MRAIFRYANPRKSASVARAATRSPPDRSGSASRLGGMIESAAMIRTLRCLLVLFAIVLVAIVAAGVPSARAAEDVDLLLVLAVDVSRSIDQPKFMLQRDGYAAAVSNSGVLEAIKSGPHQKIALNFVEWSGFGAQKLVIDWTVIDGPTTARHF